MGKKLFVGSISFRATEDDLRDLFSGIGAVESAKIITDSHTGQSKGFGFVEMSAEEDAEKAIAELNGSSFMERTIVVSEARPQQKKERRDFGSGRGGHRSDRGRGESGKGSGDRWGRR